MIRYLGQWTPTRKPRTLFNQDKRRYKLRGGVTLLVDPDEFRYHQHSRDQVPTVIVRIISGKVSQTDVAKAASRIRRVGATATTRIIEIRTDSKVITREQAFDLCETFVDELRALLQDRSERKERVSNGDARGRTYVNRSR